MDSEVFGLVFRDEGVGLVGKVLRDVVLEPLVGEDVVSWHDLSCHIERLFGALGGEDSTVL